MSTIKEIAKACNVSIATVSKVLNHKAGASEETTKYILETAEKMNYMPNYVAKNLKMKKTKTIGVIAEDMTVFSLPDIIDGITEYCEEKEYHILLVNLRLYKKFQDKYYQNDDYMEIASQEIKELLSKQVDGIIYVAAHERKIRCIPKELNIPAVMAYGYSSNKGVPSFVVNDIQAGYEIVSYLAKNHHKRIGVITGKFNSLHSQERLLGYQEALYDHEILYNPSFVVEGDWTRKSGYEATDQLLDKGVTAIFCMNDLMAGGVYDRLEELHLEVGKDVSVVGFDNREMSSYYQPPLTTIALPLHDIGYEAAQMIVALLEADDDEKKDLEKKDVCRVDCRMEVRESVRDLK